MKISLIVPLFNEKQTVGVFYRAVRQDPLLQAYTVEMVFINDGSNDRTAQTGEVVLAKRRDRSSDGYLKRHSASLFYRLST